MGMAAIGVALWKYVMKYSPRNLNFFNRDQEPGGHLLPPRPSAGRQHHLVHDNNQITCDGSVDLCNTEDVNAKMRAWGWHVLEVAGRLLRRRGHLIGIGSKVAGDAKAHGAAYGSEDVRSIKRAFGMDPDEHFALERDWDARLAAYAEHHPRLHAQLALRVEGKFPRDWRGMIPGKEALSSEPMASRKSAGLICNPLAAGLENLMVGTPDLSPSVAMMWNDKPDLRTECGIDGNYAGRYIHFGVREHTMAAIANDLAAFNKGSFLPIISSFLMFYIYAAPTVRMGALQGIQATHIATHDSIGTGEDGPTRQPIALAQLYRAMPNVLYIRPCDTEETAGAFYPEYSSREGVQRGGYVFVEDDDSEVTLFGVGAEMRFAIEARTILRRDFSIKARAISLPCQHLFDAQPPRYKREVPRYHQGQIPRVAIEAYAVNGWERYANAGFTMASFGKSLPGKEVYKYFGFDGAVIAKEVARLVADGRRDGI
ncbi:Transketolase, C-terminal/Pyruvate-ferredoxin oxidoreductase, domain II [Cordyceps fumosorosea ARSEF 2679]|uniref:Transketolase, C-terminal/Pyruvate-ferredoxin oxidoreductase, domain II n=1 Tax=Cordyceps fumosorosea (strain ARSEF 2679) TaxID=1081104 RepID=A0A167MQL7_CORFA|nr:Transketolase, C-terminal/Pyruvate-ferredoxin oxidoreductase, domain II [Cordyceps fumosorosea ARSEF 2679]OAA54651.1 Transketolase, C-terminal/Pyruvate-ferredoxin oxidoreductase, domain II [Cordyceps fumosorosea ARSEF 2679]